MAESDAGGGGGAGRWEDGAVIVLPAGSAAWRQQQGEHQEAPPPERALYKTRLCDKFQAGGRCAYEDGCTFAHGAAELRPPLPLPARRRPGAGEHADAARGAGGVNGGGGGFYGGKVCFEFRDKGACHWGDKCAYAHVSAAEVAEMRFAGGPRQAEHARRSATPPGRASSRAGGTCYAPAAARPLPPAPAVAAPGEAKVTPLELLSRKKLAGVYGDWYTAITNPDSKGYFDLLIKINPDRKNESVFCKFEARGCSSPLKSSDIAQILKDNLHGKGASTRPRKYLMSLSQQGETWIDDLLLVVLV
ncbi:hypothetical protein ACP70R_015084 [Stipagrostis hirtigluma subsp. patula]